MIGLVAAPSTRRLTYIDSLRSVLVAWIIAGHALLGYTAIGGWPYDEVNEVTLAPRSELVLSALLGPTALFVIGTFFFLAGLVAEPAVGRKGPGRFATDRMLRLGLPFLAFAGLVWPLCMWMAYRAAGRGVSYWWAFTHRQPLLDSGPLWFVEVLLYICLGYAAWRWAAVRLLHRPDPRPVPLGGRHLTALAAVMAAGSFGVRLWFPARSTQILDLHLWQWPQCVVMFALGVMAARQDWPTMVPERLYRGCGYAVALTLAAVPVLALGLGVSNVARDAGPFLGGWHWQALLLASVEASLAVAGSVWLVGWAQRRWTRDDRLAARYGRDSYAAFMLQAPVLLALAVVARPLPWPAGAKALLVAALGTVGCFMLASRMSRTRSGRIQ